MTFDTASATMISSIKSVKQKGIIMTLTLENPQTSNIETRQASSQVDREQKANEAKQYAIDAVERLSFLLDKKLSPSPNTPTGADQPVYLGLSQEWFETNREAITKQTEDSVAMENFDNEGWDLWRLEILKGEGEYYETHGGNGQPIRLHKMILASEIMHDGIREATDRALTRHNETLSELIRRLSDNDLVGAISAQMTRMHYLQELSRRHPHLLSQREAEGFRNTYDNNIISNILTAGHREVYRKQNRSKFGKAILQRAA